MQHTHIIARGICIREGQILLAFSKQKKHYFLPGGHVEYGESARDTLTREIQEETGVVSQAGDLLGIFEHLWSDMETTQHEINIIFSLEIAPTDTIVSKEEPLEFEWVSLSVLSKKSFLPKELISPIKGLLEKKRFPNFLSSIGTGQGTV